MVPAFRLDIPPYWFREIVHEKDTAGQLNLLERGLFSSVILYQTQVPEKEAVVKMRI
jgi:hypothetical protein